MEKAVAITGLFKKIQPTGVTFTLEEPACFTKLPGVWEKPAKLKTRGWSTGNSTIPPSSHCSKHNPTTSSLEGASNVVPAGEMGAQVIKLGPWGKAG